MPENMLDEKELSKLDDILTPYIVQRRQELDELESKFVHYTSSENAKNILKGECLWMRNTACMNDFSEVEYGYSVLLEYFNTEWKKLNETQDFNPRIKIIIENAINLFDHHWKDLRSSIYLSSVSLHKKDEEGVGRLSMWRAYGNDSGASAALILNNPTPTEGLNVFLCPARYCSKEVIYEELNLMFKTLNDEVGFISELENDFIRARITLSLILLTVSLKHKGFREEEEWRIVYLPELIPSIIEIDHSVEVINGLPQIVYKLPLKGNMSLEKIVHQVLIGPSRYPVVQVQAFRELLKGIGISEPDSRIGLSNIPLRT